MAYFVGLDVSEQGTAVCIVDEVGKVICERKVPTEPDDIAVLLTSVGGDFVRVGIGSGPLSQWLVYGLSEADLPVICAETRHIKALLKAQEQRMLLTSRKLLQRKLLDIECDMRGTLRNFGLKVGVVSAKNYEARIRELVDGFPRLAAIVDPLLTVREVMRQQQRCKGGLTNRP